MQRTEGESPSRRRDFTAPRDEGSYHDLGSSTPRRGVDLVRLHSTLLLLACDSTLPCGLESFVLVLYNGNDRDERDSRNDQKRPDPQSLCSDLSHPRNYRKQVRRC
jgi:hypothetical protein